MALNEVGVLAYSQGFALSRDEYIIRELALCDWTGHHHVLFKYLLPVGVSYDQLSEEAKTRVERQSSTVHGLPFEPYTAYNRQDFHPYHQIRDDLIRWCHQYLTPERWRLGVFTHDGLYRLLQEPQFSYPIVVLEDHGCRELTNLPIATVNVMATQDQGRNWCMDHTHGARESGVWHHRCAHVRACQLSGWLRRHSNVLPTLYQVNAQRVLWQKRCDRLLDQLLCNHCLEAKGWIGSRLIAVIADQSDAFSNKPSLNGNGKHPSCMLMMNPILCGLGTPFLSLNNLFPFLTDHAADYLHGRRQRCGHPC